MHAAVGMIDTPEDLAYDVARPALAFLDVPRFAPRVIVVTLGAVSAALGSRGHMLRELLADRGESLGLHGCFHCLQDVSRAADPTGSGLPAWKFSEEYFVHSSPSGNSGATPARRATVLAQGPPVTEAGCGRGDLFELAAGDWVKPPAAAYR